MMFESTAGSSPADSRKSPGTRTGLRNRRWKRFLRGPDPALLEELYIPALSEAVRYDRCCAYFSSTVLAAASRGFGPLIARLVDMGAEAPRPAVRLVVNEELSAEDVRALTETGDETPLALLLQKRFRNPQGVLEKKRLEMLGWLVKADLLEVRVGVMRRGGGILHAKYGIATDGFGDAVVFSGSGNETAQGLLGNYERLEVSTSWEDSERHREYADEFGSLWLNAHPDVATVTLPEALRLRLIKLAPKEPPIAEPSNALARQRAEMVWRFIVEAPFFPEGSATCDATALVDQWPHQQRVVEETGNAWPEGRLLCDEVGMGKTIEAILILRRLMAGRGVGRVLILLPAGLLKQWQGELFEKGGMSFPRLEGQNALIWPDGRTDKVSGIPEALARDSLLMSRETARTEANAPLLYAASPWDLVVLDESHAARRRRQEEGDFNSGTLLLNLMRQLQLRRRVRGILLLSATPMQTSPWEPWDLLGVLGEGGPWLADFASVREFYDTVAGVARGRCDLRLARRAAALIAGDPEFPPPPDGFVGGSDARTLAQRIAFAPPTQLEAIAAWLRQGSPLARRMHRNTRNTLRQYYNMGLLTAPPPRRSVRDISYDYRDPAERAVYNAVGSYIDRRFDQLESEKPGKGFVMTIYRRRASSSPFALLRSLRRRREGLQLVVQQKAYDPDLPCDEDLDSSDLDDLGEFEGVGRITAAYPTDPQVARAEMEEVDRVLSQLGGLGGRDSKRDTFYRVLQEITQDGRAVLVFTEYADTMEYLRDTLREFYGKSMGCYSGGGGQLWDGVQWRPVTKDVITASLRRGDLRILVCTDAASEGLNLQAAGAVINYDLPWNPSRVEQRIGRIDRIGQKCENVYVINIFLKDSVDDRVYRALQNRCGLFEHFVGPMQPVLARARRMLLGHEAADTQVLENTAAGLEQDSLNTETYLESAAALADRRPAPLTREQVVSALGYLKADFGFRARRGSGPGTHVITSPGWGRRVFGSSVEAIEGDHKALPLTPLEPRLRELVHRLQKAGENLPLVIGSHQSGAFRASKAYWVGDGSVEHMGSFIDLQAKVDQWDGTCPDPRQVLRAEEVAHQEAQREVASLESRACRREQEGLKKQVESARLRLTKELGRYLVCLGGTADDLNGALHQQMSREIVGAQRLRRCLDRLGGYPDWSADLTRELQEWISGISEPRRKGRLLGKELDAALDDPRWQARTAVGGSS